MCGCCATGFANTKRDLGDLPHRKAHLFPRLILRQLPRSCSALSLAFRPQSAELARQQAAQPAAEHLQPLLCQRGGGEERDRLQSVTMMTFCDAGLTRSSLSWEARKASIIGLRRLHCRPM